MARKNLYIYSIALLVWGVFTVFSCSAIGGFSLISDIKSDVDKLCSVPSRVVGYPGHDIALTNFQQAVESISGVKVWKQEFPVMMPKVQEAELILSGGLLAGKHRIYPLWPASMRMNTTPADGIKGKLIYVGKAGFEDIPVKTIHGQIAVMEMSGGAAWQTLFALGAKAVVLLGSDEMDSETVSSHLLPIPANFPRFFVPDGELARELRAQKVMEGSLYAKSEWSEATAVNTYALVKSKTPQKPEQALVVVVPFDSMSVVPELAPGADGAVDVAVAMALLRHFADNPPERPVLFAFLDGVAINQLGTREMLLSLGCTSATRGSLQELIRESKGKYIDLMTAVADLKNGNIPVSGSEKKWESLLCKLGLWSQMHESRTIPFVLLLLGLLEIFILAGVVIKRDKSGSRGKGFWGKASTGFVLGFVLALIGGLSLMYGKKESLGEPAGKNGFMTRIHMVAYNSVQDPVKQEFQRELLDLTKKLEPLRLAFYRLKEAGPEKERMGEELRVLEERRRTFMRTQEQFLKKSTIIEEYIPVAEEMWNRAWARMQGQLAGLENIFERDRQRDEIRFAVLRELGFTLSEDKESELLPVSFVLGLDLSDAGTSAGPLLFDSFLGASEEQNARDFVRWLRMLIKGGKEIVPRNCLAGINLAPVEGKESVKSHIVGASASLTAPMWSFEIPAVTWATLNAFRVRVDTPNDDSGRLDWDRLGPQIKAAVNLINSWVSDDDFVILPSKLSQSVSRGLGYVVDQAQGEPIARLPMAGYIAAIAPFANDQNMYIACPGMRCQEFTRSGMDGMFIFDGILGKGAWPPGVSVCSLDNAGAIVGTINHIKSKPSGLVFNRGTKKPRPVRTEMFACQEYSLVGLFDPRFLVPLLSVDLFDAIRGDPKRSNMSIYNGMMTFALEPEAPWQLLLRVGIVGNRMALVNMVRPEESENIILRKAMKGFPAGSGLPLHPMHISAQDFYNIDVRRVLDYRKAGISSKAIEAIQQTTRDELDAVDKAYKADNGEAYFRHIGTALANEVNAYRAIKDMANDVVKGVIFLLLVLVPSAYAMERLVLASTHVYKQVIGSISIFVLMMAVLWSFHPAFRISSMPLMIVMAFGIIFLSLMVIQVVYAKFESELEKLRRGQAVSHKAEGAGLKLLTTQIRLGLANMRKRPLRTALTGITVMLITFALLCFMSASTYVEKTEYSISDRNVAPSILIQQPGFAMMPPAALTFLSNEMEGRALMSVRYWGMAEDFSSDVEWRLHVYNKKSDAVISVMGSLGVSSNEAMVSGIDKICPNWDEFARNGGCYLSAENARDLGVEAGDVVIIGGSEMKLVGVFDSVRLDSEMKTLDGGSLMPPNYSLIDMNKRREKTTSDMAELFVKLQSGLAGEDKNNELPAISSRDMVIVSVDHNEKLPMKLRSVAFPAGSHEAARNFAMEISRKLSFPIYYSSPGGVRVVVSRPLAPKAPKSLLVPLLIAGFIIFNTMLSSLAERKKEIYVYTSLGLAPFHIGVMFLTEALTYGVLGSIFGYIGGQGLATIFTKLGWMGGITLNFGGSQAVLTMMMVLGIVVISSLMPAYLAGKVATPSNKMTWSVPEPVIDKDKNDVVINDILPFTATSRTAAGVMAFLYDYFDAHRDGAIGHMTTADLSVSHKEVADTQIIRIKGTVWLAPYDMGVRQEMEIVICELFGEDDIHEIGIRLKHGSGQLASWRRLNKQYLVDLRRQLLGWRKLDSDSVLGYIAQGNKMLEGNAKW